MGNGTRKLKNRVGGEVKRQGTVMSSTTTRLLACKAAALSASMLTRRKSSQPSDGKTDGGPRKRRGESVVALTEIINLEPSAINKKPSEILQNDVLKELVRLACLLSMISVCLHTPETIALWPPLNYAIFANDCIVTLVFLVEAAIHIHHVGLWEYRPWFGVIRSPRPFIMLRFIRSLVRFKLPRNRIKQIIKRSSQQIQNVTIFFMFFMALYAIMGVQLFGRMDYHCVLSGTDPRNVTIADLAIPDTMCSQKGEGGYECPDNMVCMKLDMSAHVEGFYGMFNDFASSLFTVYMAASQEGWVYVLYDCLDTLPSYVAFFYFVTLIFFLAWLVKRLERFEGGWRLVEVDHYSRSTGSPRLLQLIVNSTVFQISMMGLVLLNALINASFVYRHDKSDAIRKEIYYYMEICFTVLFNIEALLKVIGYGWKNYVRRGQHKFELILCVGSTLNLIRPLYNMNIFTYFQVFRIVRLIKASPMLEDFVYKIFGPGKKLGGLVIFTMVLLFITSAISLQLFCYVPNLKKFTTFPMAFMSMFQIITQEGWTDVVVEILRATNESMVPFVAIYFVGYHLLVTLIVLSLFVAVILDNLEMDEELKKVKQLKAREQNTIKTTLPWRLRVFDRFPTRPQMISLKKVTSEFPLPKIRDSFTRQFADDSERCTLESVNDIEPSVNRSILRRGAYIRAQRKVRMRHIGQISSRHIVSSLLDESNRNRALYCDTNQIIPPLGRGMLKSSKGTPMGSRSRGFQSMKGKSHLEGMNENGDVRPTDSAPKKDPKQGEIDIKALQQKRAHAEITRNRIEEEMRENHPLFDRPLFAVGRDSRLRILCQNIVYAQYSPERIDPVTGKQIVLKYKQLHDFIGLMTYLDWAMVFVTSLSCWSMLFESPWPTTGENLIFNNPYLQITEYLYVVSMTFELMVKVIANGLFFTPKAVVKDVGDIMTFFIYFTSVIYLLWMPSHVEINSWAQLLMIMRAMRPLRIYTLVPHIRRVVVELCRGFKEILLVTILLIVLMFVFASFGVQIVGGKLAACNDPTITARENCTGIFEQKIFVTRMEVYGKNDDKLHPKILVPRVWTNPRNFNFDHIGNAMLALFETLSYKGWNVIRDILYLRQGPWAVLFIHIYVFIGCMIGLTLFVGVVVANYTENRGTALLTVDQRRWHDLKARLKMAQPLHVPPKPPESAKLRSYLYDLTLSKAFKQSFAILVVVNSFTLVVPWNVEEEKQRRNVLFGLTVMSAFCNILFTIEILLKAVAFTVRGFWQSRRNRGDFFITMLGLTWIVFHFLFQVPAYIAGGINEWKRLTYTFGYMVVILRFFTIAGRKSTLKMLMLTVLMSMVRSLFIIAAMFLLVLFYAYTGVILFGMVKYGQAVSKHVNFRNGREALVVLFRSVTGEDWNDIMHDCMRSPPFCYWAEGLNYWETDCGNYFGAILYFCSFYLIITYIVLNVLVAIIMENFSLFYSSEEDALLSYADIRNFQQVWNYVDADQKRSIPTRRVKFLLRLLRGRLEVDPNKDRLLFKHMCYEMERLHNGEDVSFHDVLNMLSYRSVDIRKSLQLEELLQREELEYLIEEEVAKQTIRAWLESCLRRIKQKQNVGQSESTVPTVLPLHRLSCLAPHVPHTPSQHNLVSAHIISPQAAQNFESFESRESVEEENGSKKRQRRRNSIPELVGEAKKFMFGSLAKRLEKATETKAGKDRRGTLKQIQMPTYELPDLEENLDEASDSPQERRHSVDTPLSNNPELLMLNTSTPSVEFNTLEQNQELHQWWTDLFEL
nr:Ion transport domain containing protein [Haemonchus contortus]